MSKQPKWRFVENFGDASPLDHGGAFLFSDTTGVYPPELEMYYPDADIAYRVLIEVAEPNDWFMYGLGDVAECVGRNPEELAKDLQSTNLRRRTLAYIDLISYHGAAEFDQYPIKLTSAEARKRYKDKGVKV